MSGAEASGGDLERDATGTLILPPELEGGRRGASTTHSGFQRCCCQSSLVSWLRAREQKRKPSPETPASPQGPKGWARQCETCQTQRASWPPPVPRRGARALGLRGGYFGPRPEVGGPGASRLANRLANRASLLSQPRGGTCQCLCTCCSHRAGKGPAAQG